MGIEWGFKVGQCVTHRDQSMPSLVMSRQRCGKDGSTEVYGVRSFAEVDPQRDRIVLGECLRDVEPGDCGDCLLMSTGLCPGNLRR